MKNILVYSLARPYFRQLERYLDEDIRVALRIDEPRFAPDDIYDIHDIDYAFELKDLQLKQNYQYRAEYLDIYPKLIKDIPIFLAIQSRFGSLNGTNDFIDMMDAFHIYIHLFIDLLKRHAIDYVVMREIPHDAHYLLYRVAQELGIKVLMFQRYSYMLNAYTDRQQSNQVMALAQIEDLGLHDHPAESANPENLQAMEDLGKSYLEDGDANRKALFKQGRKANFEWRNLLKGIVKRDLDLVAHSLLGIRRDIQFKRCYRRYAQQDIPSAKFVYFPLHLQPEMSTAPLGGRFFDQVLAIECVRALLPDDWHIAVKENPLQTYRHRSVLFYERLRHIPNTHYLSKEVNSKELIEQCEFVATVTGTAGLEALHCGKNALIFGQAPYQRFPGVTRYREDLSLQEILAARVTAEDLSSAYSQLASQLEPEETEIGLLTNIENFDCEQNSRSLAAIINRFVQTHP